MSTTSPQEPGAPRASSERTSEPSIPVKKGEVFGWAFFDFANSSFTTVVITAIYSRFFIEHIVPPESAIRDSYWSLAMVLSTFIGMLLSPVLGVMSDLGALKKVFLVGSTLLCASSTAALYFAGPGDVHLAIACLVLASVGFMIGENFCASFLPDISTRETMGKISGIGWGIGYFGGLASLILVMTLVKADPAEQTAVYISQNQLAMVATGLFFLVAAMPTFLFVHNRQRPQTGFSVTSPSDLLRVSRSAFGALWGSIRRIRNHPGLAGFLLAFTIYMAGLDAVIKFVGIYASSELSFGTAEITIMFLVLQISAAAGALGFGYLESRIGAKRTVEASLVIWIVGIGLIMALPWLADATGMSQQNLFFGISLLAGTGLGATQSSSRTIVGLLTPAKESGEVFGYWGFFMKLATILGMLFGVLSDAIASRRLALTLVLGFFVVGLWLLSRLELPAHASRPHPGN